MQVSKRARDSVRWPCRTLARRLMRNRDGLALLEFAFSLPLVLGIGMFGIETASLAVANLRISQIALNLADNASRVGLGSDLNTVQLREVDINDVLTAARLEGQKIDLTRNGRITVSSLEDVKQSYDSAPVQRIHWQRCLGLMTNTDYQSSYGTVSPTAGSDATSGNAGLNMPDGMGDSPKVTAPAGSGLIFVEINYLYKPLVAGFLMKPTRLHYTASFIIRDARDWQQVYNPGNAEAATCNNYTA